MLALLLCDEPDETALLSVALRRLGATVNAAADLVRGQRAWAEQPADLVVLALHQRGAHEHVLAIRRLTDVPLVAIAPQADEDALCRLLDAGADWTLSRPYSSRLFVAQVRALLRRGLGTALDSLPILTVGDLALDPATRTVRVAEGAPRRLTQLEFRLLTALMTHRGQVLPTGTLIERVWGYEAESSLDLVRGLVRRLRAKVEPNLSEPRYILTVAGVGYVLGGLEAGTLPDSTTEP
jgi:two-component system response regulator RegX3